VCPVHAKVTSGMGGAAGGRCRAASGLARYPGDRRACCSSGGLARPGPGWLRDGDGGTMHRYWGAPPLTPAGSAQTADAGRQDGSAGSSRMACTASARARQAATGSAPASTAASAMSDPAARKPGSHSTRCRTTSRAVQPATGAGTSQSFTPSTRSVKAAATRQCRCAGVAPTSSERAIGQQPVELRVALLDAGLHAAAEPGVARLEAVDERLGVQSGPAVAEVLEPQRLERDAVRVALPGEGLHDPVLADLVEAAVEPELVVAVRVDESP